VKAERIRQDAARAIQQFKDELAKRSVKTLLANSAAPVSEAKLAANRANSQLSTGPVTPEGLAKSSQNARKHGLYSKQLVAPGEDPADLDALRASLFAEHQPQTETEALLITEMADSYWRLCRARRLEAALLTQDVLTHLSAAQRMMTSAERAFYKALKTLTELRKVSGFVPQKPKAEVPEQILLRAATAGTGQQSGFVPQNNADDAKQPKHPLGPVPTLATLCDRSLESEPSAKTDSRPSLQRC
jgi:hypothetical protein